MVVTLIMSFNNQCSVLNYMHIDHQLSYFLFHTCLAMLKNVFHINRFSCNFTNAIMCPVQNALDLLFNVIIV